MKALIQRVTGASVSVGGEEVGKIGAGLLVLLGFARGDDRRAADRMLDKLLAYRVFSDATGRMNLNVAETGGGVLVISQFTLCADTRTGLRPGFSAAMVPGEAEPMYQYFVQQLHARHTEVAVGVFGADMQVSLVNDGPVTFLLEVQGTSE